MVLLGAPSGASNRLASRVTQQAGLHSKQGYAAFTRLCNLVPRCGPCCQHSLPALPGSATQRNASIMVPRSAMPPSWCHAAQCLYHSSEHDWCCLLRCLQSMSVQRAVAKQHQASLISSLALDTCELYSAAFRALAGFANSRRWPKVKQVGCSAAGVQCWRAAGVQCCWGAVLEGCWSAVLEGCWAARVQCWSAGLQGCRGAGVQCWGAGLLGCWAAGLQGCRGAGVLECSAGGVLGCWGAGAPGGGHERLAGPARHAG
jgi:hypothetical protein